MASFSIHGGQGIVTAHQHTSAASERARERKREVLILVLQNVQDITGQGQIQNFQIEGAQKLYARNAHSDHEALKSFTTGVQGPFKGPGSSMVLDALSWYLSLILMYSNTKLDFIKHSQSKCRGGALLLCHPVDPLMLGTPNDIAGLSFQSHDARKW